MDYIYLHGSSSLTIPEGVTQVRDISLHDSASLAIPEGVTQVGNIELYDSASLTLPEGVTQVGETFLHPGASVIFPDGFVLKGDSFGVRNIDAETMNKLLSKHKKMDHKCEVVVENFKKENPGLVNHDTKAVCIGELTSLPLDYERQLEMTGRIDGPVCLLNPEGEDILVCVQKDGDTLISMRSDDIMSAIDKISSQEEPMLSINVDGQRYQMRKDNYDSFKYGQGGYAVNAETGEKAYLIFDVKEKKVVKTEKFETVLSKKLQEEKAKANKAIAQSIGQKATVPKSQNGIK